MQVSCHGWVIVRPFQFKVVKSSMYVMDVNISNRTPVSSVQKFAQTGKIWRFYDPMKRSTMYQDKEVSEQS